MGNRVAIVRGRDATRGMESKGAGPTRRVRETLAFTQITQKEQNGRSTILCHPYLVVWIQTIVSEILI